MLRFVCAAAAAAAALAAPIAAGPTPAVHGGGKTNDGARFALAISGGDGHFDCLMPAQMTVEATVTAVTSIGASAVTFTGTAAVTLGGKNPFGLPAGPLVRGEPFVASATAGGPGVGTLDLKILGLDFPGTVENGRISITP